MVDVLKQVEKFKEFIKSSCEKKLHDVIKKGERSLVIDFLDLLSFDVDLAEEILNEPIETIKAAESALDQFDPPQSLRVRFFNIPESQNVMIKDIRSSTLGTFVAIEGIVRQASDVRPQVTSAKFECPACGNNITILQLDSRFKEPMRCSCGRRGKFRFLSKALVDAQRLVIEEAPESLEGGEQPKRLSVFLKEDLVEPKMEKKTTPGSKVIVTGVITEVPILLKSGAQSTRYDIALDSNYIMPAEETFTEMDISSKEEEEIKNLAKDPAIYEKLIASISPSIYGHDDVKEALLLQLVGGTKKTRKDGTVSRGDIHILLVGDPGSGKSMMLSYISKIAPKGRLVSGKGATAAGLCIAPDSLVAMNPGSICRVDELVNPQLTQNAQLYREGILFSSNNDIEKKVFTLGSNLKINPKPIEKYWKLKPPEYMIRLVTSYGKEIITTPNTSLFSIKKGYPIWKEASDINIGDYLAGCREFKFKNSNRILTITLIKSNPIIGGVKHHIKKMIDILCSNKNTTIRGLAKELSLNENKLYHHWINNNARGNIHLKDLLMLVNLSDYNLEKVAKDIKFLSLRRGHKIKIPLYLDEDFMYFAGLIAGDGDVDSNGERAVIRLSNNSKEIQSRFKEILNNLFGINCYISSEASVKRAESWRFGSKIIAEISEELGIPRSPKSHRIEMTNHLLSLPDTLLNAFLSGYFDADGSPIKRKSGSNHIEVGSASEKFTKKLQLVLTRYGIQSKLIAKRPKQTVKKDGKLINSKHNKNIIIISGKKNLELFRDKIGFRMNKKRQKLDKIIDSISYYHTNKDRIPGAEKIIKELAKRYNLTSKEVFGYKTSNYYSGRRRLSYIYFKKIVHKLNNLINKNDEDLKKLNLLANSDIIWEEVIKKELIYNHGYEFVYDLTVADSHNFIVNGLVVHNTATVVKDEFLRGWALEAGAMVLANGGIAIIDELDKMSAEDRSALHEAMEQQRITISKANIQATLKSETTVLAAANPKLGRFDPYTPIATQIDLPPTLINRFDLIFPIRDIPNRELDDKIAGHILALHQKPMVLKTEIPSDMLKKYIAYSKQRVSPKLTHQAIEEIKNFYVGLRSLGSSSGEEIKPIPISARQLEALVRLAEGSAKIHLSNKVRRKDAKRAIDILKKCLMQVGFDYETGRIDIDRISTGITAAQRSKIVVIREIINALEAKGAKAISISEIISEAEAKGIEGSKVEEIIEKLKRSGDLYEPKLGFLSKL